MAAPRSMAQAAKVLGENPLLVRLKELEACKELAGKVGQVNLVLGAGVLPQLQLKTQGGGPPAGEQRRAGPV